MQESSKEPKSNGEKRGNKSLRMIIIFLVIIIAGALIAAFFIFRGKNNSPNNANVNAAVNINELVNENTNTNINENINQNANININTNENVNVNINVNTADAPSEEVNPVRPPRDETVVTASSTLVDDTGAGFDYSPGQVLDQDFSTSWVEGVNGDGIGEWIKMQFSAPARINTLGIVPGLASDNDTYLKNNRIKSFELEFSDGTKLNKELTDNYGMHFVEFPTTETDYIKLIIKSVFQGTKYEDTPIAELDIWSDYVLNKDAQAALDFYKTYKESSASKPAKKYISKVYMAIGIMGSPTPEIPVNFYPPATEPFIAAAEIPASTPNGITFTVKWYNEGHLFKTEEITSYTAIESIEVITLSSAAYIKDLSGATAIAWALGDYTVEWYENNILSKTVNFAVTPE